MTWDTRTKADGHVHGKGLFLKELDMSQKGFTRYEEPRELQGLSLLAE